MTRNCWLLGLGVVFLTLGCQDTFVERDAFEAEDLRTHRVAPPPSDASTRPDTSLADTTPPPPDTTPPPPDTAPAPDTRPAEDTQPPPPDVPTSNLELCNEACGLADNIINDCFGGNTVGGRDPSTLFLARRSLAFFIGDATPDDLLQLAEDLSATAHLSSDGRVIVFDGAPRLRTRELASEVEGLGAELPTLATITGRRIVATDRLVLRFSTEVHDVEDILATAGAAVVRPLGFGEHGFVAELIDPRADVFEAAAALSARADVRYAAPDFIRSYEHRVNDPYFDRQWHLDATDSNGAWLGADINALDAWALTEGDIGSVIAINDDGVDIGHPDIEAHLVRGFSVPPQDRMERRFDNGCCAHGTAVAGVAAAVGENNEGVRGVCPQCGIMPIFTGLDFADDSLLSESLTWPADNGAAVVNNSWGPTDGDPTILDEPPRSDLSEPLSPVVEDAIQHAFTQGRGGLGTVLVFAGGNGNEAAGTDPFVAHPLTIGVAALEDRGTKSWYSDFGPEIDLAAPSSGGLTPGIFSADIRQWYGYNPGDTMYGDARGDYTSEFGGTSSAAPVVSGVIGLMVAANPALTAAKLREMVIATADPIDPLRGAYDTNGKSRFYGAGKVNAYRAVRAAMAPVTCVAIEDERCNGVDDTCDGQIDEGCPTLSACAPCAFDAQCGADSVCAHLPGDEGPHCVARCDANGACASGTCRAGICVPPGERCAPCEASERCNGVDDNCDGQIDESGCDIKRLGEDCDFDGECHSGARCIGKVCITRCSSTRQCGDEFLICAEHTNAFAEVEDFKVCGYHEPTCAEARCGPETNEQQRQSFLNCLQRAGTDCEAIYYCVLGF